MTGSQTIAALTEKFPATQWDEFRGQPRVVVDAGEFRDVISWLRQERDFDLLVDITCVDYLHYRHARDRFGLVYLLAAGKTNERLTLRVFLNEPDLNIPSITGIWEGANWMEREVWDMFGIVFTGHPDLRRILLPEEFSAHPLRKDYPLQGRGERHNFPVLKRGSG